MKKAVLAVFVVLVAVSMSFGQTCATIKDGSILDANGTAITLGYDEFGYNYQARIFNGTYDGADRKLDGTYYGQTGDFINDKLIMKWSDEWLSNKDCFGSDHKLDRGGPTGNSMGWVTNQIEGDYLGSDGDYHHYTYHSKIVFDAGVACSFNKPECIWGSYAIIEETQNDPFGEYGGKIRNRLMNPAGLGHYTN
jgi:hypothetical protein